MALINITDLDKNYISDADCVMALKGVNLSIEEGSFLGVLGPSGSGKSTLLSILGGLTHPSEGCVEIDGIDIYSLTNEKQADFRREYLGFVFQAFNLVPYLTALENVMLPLAVISIPVSKKREKAMKVLEQVGLVARKNHLPSQLSGGEQERVAVARALVNDPPLILADEPTGSLDSETSSGIMQLLSDLNAQGQTIVMVTHNLENVSFFSRAVYLRDGCISDDKSQQSSLRTVSA